MNNSYEFYSRKTHNLSYSTYFYKLHFEIDSNITSQCWLEDLMQHISFIRFMLLSSSTFYLVLWACMKFYHLTSNAMSYTYMLCVLKNVWVYDAIWDNDLGNLDNRRQVWIIIGYETRIGNKGFFDWQQEKSLILQ